MMIVWSCPHIYTPVPLAKTQHDVHESPIPAQLLVSSRSPLIQACIIFEVCASGEVYSYYIKIIDHKCIFVGRLLFKKQHNVLHICWPCYNNTSKHLAWHAKEWTSVIWFWAKNIYLGVIHFRSQTPCKCKHKKWKILFNQAFNARSFGGARVFCSSSICQ